MSTDIIFQYGEFAYATVILALLVYVLVRIKRNVKSPHTEASSEHQGIAQTEPELKQATTEDSIYNAPWWFRYPASVGVFAGSYWAFFEWEKKSAWIVGALLALIGLGLVRELFLGVVVALIAGFTLWAVGAAVAALPVSAAIIIGAMIIAQAMHR